MPSLSRSSSKASLSSMTPCEETEQHISNNNGVNVTALQSAFESLMRTNPRPTPRNDTYHFHVYIPHTKYIRRFSSIEKYDNYMKTPPPRPLTRIVKETGVEFRCIKIDSLSENAALEVAEKDIANIISDMENKSKVEIHSPEVSPSSVDMYTVKVDKNFEVSFLTKNSQCDLDENKNSGNTYKTSQYQVVK